MNERPHADLISAYLDGELEPAERAEAERLLAESAECRQLLDDFRGLQADLRSLPKQKLEPNFHERVLRQAERAALAGDTAAAAGATATNVPANGQGDSPSVLRFPRSWHAWRWAAVAAAAAVMIWLVGREPAEDGRKVAPAPAVPEQAAPPADRGEARKLTEGRAPAPESLGRNLRKGAGSADATTHFEASEPAPPAPRLKTADPLSDQIRLQVSTDQD